MNNKFALLVILSSFLIIPIAFAQTTPCDQLKAENDSLKEVVKQLKDKYSASKAPNKASFTTRNGFVFNRVAKGWKDAISGKIWYDDKKRNVDQEDAKNFCAKRGQILPSKNDFEVAESHGISEVFKDMRVEDRLFWSSSLITFDSKSYNDRVYCYSGYGGYLIACLYDFDKISLDYGVLNHYFVRCVSR